MRLFHYLQVHGQKAGPTQRPELAGLLTGLIAASVALLVLHWQHALPRLAQLLGLSLPLLIALHMITATLEGMLYGAVFRRAANSAASGWLLGLIFALFMWLGGPVILVEGLLGIPAARYAVGLPVLTSHLSYGLVLGILFPYIHSPLHRRLEHIELNEYGPSH